jgi:hypothetical protein
VRYLVDEGVDDFDAMFDFISDLRTDEAVTVERVRRGRIADGESDRNGVTERNGGVTE